MRIALVCLTLILAPVQTKDVTFRKVSFRYDPSLTGKILVKQASAEAIEGPDWEGPAHLSFVFGNSYADGHRPSSYQTPELRIYRVGDFEKALPDSRLTIARLQSLLSANALDTWKGEIPYLPEYAAIELFHCRLKLLESRSISGVRFLTAYAQDGVEISNRRLQYAFSGLSKNGKYYLVARFPVFVSEPESDEWERRYEKILNSNLTDDSPEYRNYLGSIIDSLEKRNEGQFDPDLRKLDRLLQSVDVSQARF